MNKLYVRLDKEMGEKFATLMTERDCSAQKAGMYILRSHFERPPIKKRAKKAEKSSDQKLKKTEIVRSITAGTAFDHVSDSILEEWTKHKKKLTGRIVDAMARELEICRTAGFHPDTCIQWQLEKGYEGFEAEWYLNDKPRGLQVLNNESFLSKEVLQDGF